VSSFRVIQGDFKRGRADLEAGGLRLRTGSIATVIIPFGAVRNTALLGRDKQSVSQKLAMTAAGSLVGGIGAGALAGGLTGPAGAVLGALAGAVIATTQRSYATCRVELHDGRTFIAMGQVEAWIALEDLVRRAEPLPTMEILDLPSTPIEESKPSLLAKALLPVQKWLPRRKTPS
jgi:hypothetical protein